MIEGRINGNSQAYRDMLLIQTTALPECDENAETSFALDSQVDMKVILGK
jgi:hypothetical protein